MIEFEKTYLAKFLPKGIEKCRKKEILDIYIPKSESHPTLRIRKNGDKYEMTKKRPVKGTDSSVQREDTIVLSKEEFDELARLEGKRVRKIRHYYDYNGINTEIDIFQDSLKGLVLVDVEFVCEEDKNCFQMPEFCLADVTQEKLFAGGMLCGKTYSDIELFLNEMGYKKL
ncbi:MAG: hypothetical protein QW165_04295 [Candidatus Woesearchaeota archaeon]